MSGYLTGDIFCTAMSEFLCEAEPLCTWRPVNIRRKRQVSINESKVSPELILGQ